MTPKERFEQIEKTLIEIAKSNAKTQALIDTRAEQQQRRDEQQQRQAEQQQRMIDELLIDRSEHERMLKRLVVNHEQHEEYLGRIERACEFIASSQISLIEAMRRHISDSHDGDNEEKS